LSGAPLFDRIRPTSTDIKSADARHVNNGESGTELDSEAIGAILPHKPPFILIDRVVEAGPDRLVAVKQTRPDDWYFKGHFPGYPVMPGVLIVEAMAQASLILYSLSFPVNRIFFFVKEKSVFLAPVVPGDCLRLVVRKVKFFESMGLSSAEGFVDGKKVAESEMGFKEKP